MADSSKEEKQNYLRENILDKGYDTNDFVDFLKARKGGEEGADVSNWSMEDLQLVVGEFISLVGNPKKNENQPTNHPNQNRENTQQNPQVQASNSNTNEFGMKDEDFGIIISDYLDCQPLEKTELSKYDNVEVKIKSYKKVDKGLFSKSYFSFLIETLPLNFNVNRRYSDFEWLKERLSIIFNTNVLPRLSKKGKIVLENKINRRMRDLEKFLNYLLKDPIIRNSKILFDFLFIENEEEFHKVKKVYDKMKTANEIKDFRAPNGKIRVNVTSNKEQYLEYIKDNAAFNETALKKIDKNFKDLRNEMNVVINRINSFCPLFDKLIKISTKYYDDNASIESYNQIKHLFESWANVLKKQNSFFFIDVKEYYKLMGGNHQHIRELVQQVENHKANYYKISKSLISKKIELFRKEDTTNWQLDLADVNNLVSFYNDKTKAYKKICFKETNNVIKIKEKYGYYLNRLISEYERMRNINAIENKAKMIQYAKKQQEIFSEYIQIMGEIIGVMDAYIIEKRKDSEVGQNVNLDIEINENYENNNNQQKNEEKNEDVNNNNNSYD